MQYLVSYGVTPNLSELNWVFSQSWIAFVKLIPERDGVVWALQLESPKQEKSKGQSPTDDARM
jgi:hypothetical protein